MSEKDNTQSQSSRAERNRQIRKKSIQLIINTALELFAEKGFYATSISNIADKASIAKGLIYHYFDSKDELLEAIVNEVAGRISSIFETIADVHDPKKKLQMLMKLSFSLPLKNPQFWTFYMNLISQPELSENIRQIARSSIGIKMTDLLPLFEELRIENAEVEAARFKALMDGIFINSLFNNNFPLEALKGNLLDNYFVIKENVQSDILEHAY